MNKVNQVVRKFLTFVAMPTRKCCCHKCLQCNTYSTIFEKVQEL